MGHRSTPPRRRTRRAVTRVLGGLAATALALLIPVSVAAHPLGNFTINHYAGLSIGRAGVDLNIVIDKAEIPAFQDRQSADADGDGSVSDDEAATWADGSCSQIGSTLRVVADGAGLSPSTVAHSVSFPPGAGGLSTLRLECRFRAAFPSEIERPTTLTFSEASFPERIGWREIVATGDGTLLDTHGLPATSPSKELTAYPADLIAQPLDIRSASIEVRPAPTAAATAPAIAAGGGVVAGLPHAVEVASVGAVPGGVGNELPDIFRTRDLTPVVALLSIATAIALGAGHALTPGHGKTLMAAYLVGSRGRPVHAVGLGLSVAVSHTLGIFVLALVIIGAEGVLAPETIARTTPTIAAVTIVAMGGWMVATEIRRRLRSRRTADSSAAGRVAATLDHDHDHHHGSGDHEPVGAASDHHDHEHSHAPTSNPTGMHSHGGAAHSHLPPGGAGLSWRSLFVLGLAGGLIPSTSALLVLLASIASGRAAYGLLLVAAFGVGMAAVMTGVGVAMVLARGRLARLPGRSPLGRLAAQAPLLASAFVLGLGVVLTYSAVAGRPVL